MHRNGASEMVGTPSAPLQGNGMIQIELGWDSEALLGRFGHTLVAQENLRIWRNLWTESDRQDVRLLFIGVFGATPNSNYQCTD